MKRHRRFYRDVRISKIAPGQWQILLDEQPAKTPAGNSLILPVSLLADAIADEWRSQPNEMRPEMMNLTRLANTAIDRVSCNRHAAVAELLQFAASDLLCFRAPGPDGLVDRQSAAWDPLLDWARERYGVQLETNYDLIWIVKSCPDLTGLESSVLQLDGFSLTAVVAAANILGSAVLALALREERINSVQAFEAAELDSLYQAKIWGQDSEMVQRNLNKMDQVSIIAKFLALNGAV